MILDDILLGGFSWSPCQHPHIEKHGCRRSLSLKICTRRYLSILKQYNIKLTKDYKNNMLF